MLDPKNALSPNSTQLPSALLQILQGDRRAGGCKCRRSRRSLITHQGSGFGVGTTMLTTQPNDAAGPQTRTTGNPADETRPAGAGLHSVDMPIRWSGTAAVLRDALTRILRGEAPKARSKNPLERLINDLGRVEVHAGEAGVSVRFHRTPKSQTVPVKTDQAPKPRRSAQAKRAKRDTGGSRAQKS
jgi:hypothetical protein